MQLFRAIMQKGKTENFKSALQCGGENDAIRQRQEHQK